MQAVPAYFAGQAQMLPQDSAGGMLRPSASQDDGAGGCVRQALCDSALADKDSVFVETAGGSERVYQIQRIAADSRVTIGLRCRDEQRVDANAHDLIDVPFLGKDELSV